MPSLDATGLCCPGDSCADNLADYRAKLTLDAVEPLLHLFGTPIATVLASAATGSYGFPAPALFRLGLPRQL